MFNRKMIVVVSLVAVASIGLLIPWVGSQAQEAPNSTDLVAKGQIERARDDVKRIQADLQKRQQELENATRRLQELEGKRDRSGDVVASLYDGKVSLTRAEFGDYLIARVGAERLEFMVNRKIVEIECAKLGITATDREVEERHKQEIIALDPKLTPEEFEKTILRRFNKNIYEWKEDTIRTKIMMEKLVRAGVKISDAGLREAFEARYGPKVECRMIVSEKGQFSIERVWESAKTGRSSFLVDAQIHNTPALLATAGMAPPIHKFFKDKELEEAAFRLKEGEISGIVKLKDGTGVILLCEKLLPANRWVRFEEVREGLRFELIEKRVAERIPEVFAEMRKRAAPKLFLGQP